MQAQRPAGAGLGALMGGLWGAEACLLAAVAIFALQAAIILVSPVMALREQPSPTSALPTSAFIA